MRGFKLSAFADDDVFDALSYTYDKWGGEQMRKYQGLLERGRDHIRQDPYLLGSKSRADLSTGYANTKDVFMGCRQDAIWLYPSCPSQDAHQLRNRK
jgi:plasmid stabilization system protein ParE